MKKVFLYTFGCKINQYDTQVMIEKFRKSGFEFGVDILKSDIVIINSCTVTAEADRQCRQLIRKVLKNNSDARIILTGCYAESQKMNIQKELSGIEVIPSRALAVEAVSKIPVKVQKIKHFDGHSRAFVKVQDGCNAFCSYCIVPYVRSHLYSRPESEVVSEVKGLVDYGYPEIVLSGIRLGLYEYGLENLLKSLISIKGDFRIRLSSIEPTKISDGLIDILSSSAGKICPNLHIPLQSASDKILKSINRKYESSDFKNTLSKVYSKVPDAGITTDVIVGFPGETEKDFKKTYNFIEENNFSRLHVFRYSSRPGTKAALLNDRVSGEVIKDRSTILRRLDKEIQLKFLKKFNEKVRKAVLEGAKGTVITDNYIRLITEPAGTSKIQKTHTIFNVKVKEKSGIGYASLQ